MTDEIATQPKQMIPRKKTVEIVAREFGFSYEQLCGKGRTKDLVNARFAAAYALKIHHNLSRPQIGAALGDRDHTTVIHALRRAHILNASCPDFARAFKRALDAISTWTPQRALVTASGKVVPAPRPAPVKSPSAAKIEPPAYRPIVSARATRHSGEYHDGQMGPQWWAANDQRFRAAMHRAHPERCPRAEAAE